MKVESILSIAAFAVIAAAQDATETVPPSMPPQATQAFNPGNVTADRKFAWCRAQTNNCRFICGGSAADNQCNNVDLTWSCVCSNNTVPDVSAYMDTIPSFICLETYAQCVESRPDDLSGQNECEQNREYCGTKNASAEYDAQSSGSATTSAGASATSGEASATSGSESSASATAGSNGASRYEITTGAFVAALLAATGFFL